MDKRTIDVSKKFSEIVRNKMKPQKVVLYGSCSRNEQTKDSDIDIAVIFDGFSGNEWEASSELWLHAWKIDNRIEPVLLDLQNDPSGFVDEVLRTGIEI